MSGFFEALQRLMGVLYRLGQKLDTFNGNVYIEVVMLFMQHTLYYARLSQGPCDFRPVSTESTSRINMKSHETPGCWFFLLHLNNCPSPTSI